MKTTSLPLQRVWKPTHRQTYIMAKHAHACYSAHPPLHHDRQWWWWLHSININKKCTWWRCSLIHNCISKCSTGGGNKRSGGNSGLDLPTRAQPWPSGQPPAIASVAQHTGRLSVKKKQSNHQAFHCAHPRDTHTRRWASQIRWDSKVPSLEVMQ